MAGGMFLSLGLIAMQNLVAASYTMCVHVRGPKNFGYAGPHRLEVGCGRPLETPQFTMLNLVVLGQNCICILTELLQNNLSPHVHGYSTFTQS